MIARYREHAAPHRLRAQVECFWTVETSQAIPDYPVLPDGCVDIVYSQQTGARIVGTMTQARHFDIGQGDLQIGVRFRPGHARAFVQAQGTDTTDQLIPIADAWGAAGRAFEQMLGNARSAESAIAILDAQLVDQSEPGIVQRLSAHIVARRGQVRVDDLAFDAGMSARQLRRLFLEQVGLSPKHFCRVIRFRHSLTKLHESRRGDFTGVALDCGYYDQAHFINEFREFSGWTPGEYAARQR